LAPRHGELRRQRRDGALKAVGLEEMFVVTNALGLALAAPL
jgi:hypothetical protein